MRHLHMGAGGLGLGLVVPVTASLPGADVSVLQREGPKFAALQSGRIYFRDVKPSGSEQSIEIGRAVSLDDFDQIRSLVLEPGAALLTTALKEKGLDSCVGLIESLLLARGSAGHPDPFYVVPCENTLGEFYMSLEQRNFGSNILFLRCVVDRLCNNARIKGGVVRVETEEYGSWIIQRRAPLTDQLEAQLPEVSFVDDLAPEIQKKRWLVNGPHFALGLLAQKMNKPLLHEFAMEEGGQHFFKGILAECGDAYAGQYNLAPSDVSEFINDVFRRFSSFYTETHRVVNRLQRDSLESLLHAAYERLVEPSEAFRKGQGRCPEYLHWALRTMHELIYVGKYVDAGLIAAPDTGLRLAGPAQRNVASTPSLSQ